MNNIYAALEIGTTRTVLAIGEAASGGRLNISCHAEIPSTGVRKSQITDIQQATQSIHSVLRMIEKKQDAIGLKTTIGNAFLIVSGQHVKSDPYSSSIQVEGGKVGQDEIYSVSQAAHSMPIPRDRELLDIIDQDYELDRRSGIGDPSGMSGRILKLNTLHISADRNQIQDARTAADATHLEIREPLFAATCAAEAVLEDHEKKNGVLEIDLGGGSTCYTAYCDGYPVYTNVIGVGGDHITNDIANAFQTTNAQAEGLKINSASALVGIDGSDSARIKVEQGENTLLDNRTISKRALDTVVNARLLELFTMIRESLEDQDILHRMHAGVVLTGGGAQMKNIEGLAKQVLCNSVRIGKPINVDGLENEPNPASFATIAGALLYAHRNYEDTSIIRGIIGRFFK